MVTLIVLSFFYILFTGFYFYMMYTENDFSEFKWLLLTPLNLMFTLFFIAMFIKEKIDDRKNNRIRKHIEKLKIIDREEKIKSGLLKTNPLDPYFEENWDEN